MSLTFRERPVAFGFDLGETLLTYADIPLSWSGLYRPALVQAAKAIGELLEESDLKRSESLLQRYNTRLYPRRIEVGADSIFAEVFEGKDPARVTLAMTAFFSFFQQRHMVYPDTMPALLGLRRGGHRTGVLTDVPYGMPRSFVEADLRLAGCRELIDDLLTSVDIGFRKPAREGFDALALRMGASPDQVVYVGNEEKDIIGARNAGMTAVLIDREGSGKNFNQDATIVSLLDLIE